MRHSILIRSAIAVAAIWAYAWTGAYGDKALKPGEYLRSDYMRSVKATRSPYAAFRMGEVQLITVSVESGETRLHEITNFHEGGAVFALSPAGAVRVLVDAGEDVTEVSLKVLSDDSFSISKDGKSERFTYVGTAATWVAGNTVAGEYQDEEGGIFEFGADGVARFPDKTFKFVIGIDHVLTPFDYLYGEKFGWCWAYRIKGDKLEIFDTKGELNTEVSPEPMLVLTKRHKHHPQPERSTAARDEQNKRRIRR